MPKPVSMKKGASDNFQTPRWAIGPLLPYIPKHWTVWESACGKGNLVDALRDAGYKVKWSDIERDSREDFFTFTPRSWDIQVTNPPFSIKTKWIQRSVELDKPFALLLPLAALSTRDRQEMYKKFQLQVMVLDHRIDFETPSGEGSGAWLDTAWYTRGLNLPPQGTLTYGHVEVE